MCDSEGCTARFNMKPGNAAEVKEPLLPVDGTLGTVNQVDRRQDLRQPCDPRHARQPGNRHSHPGALIAEAATVLRAGVQVPPSSGERSCELQAIPKDRHPLPQTHHHLTDHALLGVLGGQPPDHPTMSITTHTNINACAHCPSRSISSRDIKDAALRSAFWTLLGLFPRMSACAGSSSCGSITTSCSFSYATEQLIDAIPISRPVVPALSVADISRRMLATSTDSSKSLKAAVVTCPLLKCVSCTLRQRVSSCPTRLSVIQCRWPANQKQFAATNPIANPPPRIHIFRQIHLLFARLI